MNIEVSPWRNIDDAPKGPDPIDILAKTWYIRQDRFIYRRFTDCVYAFDPNNYYAWKGVEKEWLPVAWMPLPKIPTFYYDDPKFYSRPE